MLSFLRYILISSILLMLLFLQACDAPKQNEHGVSGKLMAKDSLALELMLDSLKYHYPQSSDSIAQFSEYVCSHFSQGLNTVYSKVAMVHFAKSNYAACETYFKKCAEVLEADSLMVEHAEILANLGVVKEVSGDYTTAIDYYLQALEFFENQNLPLKSSVVYNNIGIVYQQLKELELALDYYHKALDISSDLGHEDLNAKRYNNIASIYDEYMLKVPEHLQHRDSAMHYYLKAHQFYVKTESQYLPIVENNIGYLYLTYGWYTKADSLFDKALSYYINQAEEPKIAPILRNQAQLYTKQAQYDLALRKLDQALRLSQTNSDKELEIELLQVYIELYEKAGRYAEANSSLKALFQLEEQVKGLEHKATIERLQVQFQVKEKVQQIEILELKNHVQNRKLWQLWFLISFLSIVLIAIIIIHRLQKKNSKLQLLQMQNDIADYVSQLEEIKEQTHKEQQDKQKDMLAKLKAFALTEREEEVLILISQGYKNAEIAEKMFVSLNTIKTHTKNIFIKLDVKNRTQAAKKAQMV